MRRYTIGAAALAFLLLTAGCLGGTPPTDTDSATPTPTATAVPGSPTPTPDPTPGETATEEWEPTTSPVDQFDADKEVRVENAWDRSVDVRVRVVRVATNETVYDEALTLEPGADRVVYNLSEADPDGIESFRITATGLNTTESVTIETNACYGNAYVEITDEGELYPFYAIC